MVAPKLRSMHLRGGQGGQGGGAGADWIKIFKQFSLIELAVDGVIIIAMYFVSTKLTFMHMFAISAF